MHVFSGIGGGILADLLLGHHPVCAVEIDPYCQQVLSQRQKDGILPWFPIFGDVQKFDGSPWKGKVDAVCGGFPCTDLSSARTNSRSNGKIRGLDGPQSGLYKELIRVVREVGPRYVLMENSPNLVGRGLGRILGELAELGFDAQWGLFSAGSIGACHERERIFIMASHPDRAQRQGGGVSSRAHQEYTDPRRNTWWKAEPSVHRVDDGTANRLDRLKSVGNAQVPRVVALAWETLHP